MEKSNGERFRMTDGSPHNGMLKRGGILYKAKKHIGHEVIYVEIDLEEYDRRVAELAGNIAKQPGVDMLAILKDALYDLPLDYLKSIEGKVNKELEKPKPEIRTKVATTYRGTCVNLNVGGKNLIEIRH